MVSAVSADKWPMNRPLFTLLTVACFCFWGCAQKPETTSLRSGAQAPLPVVSVPQTQVGDQTPTTTATDKLSTRLNLIGAEAVALLTYDPEASSLFGTVPDSVKDKKVVLGKIDFHGKLTFVSTAYGTFENELIPFTQVKRLDGGRLFLVAKDKAAFGTTNLALVDQDWTLKPLSPASATKDAPFQPVQIEILSEKLIQIVDDAGDVYAVSVEDASLSLIDDPEILGETWDVKRAVVTGNNLNFFALADGSLREVAFTSASNADVKVSLLPSLDDTFSFGERLFQSGEVFKPTTSGTFVSTSPYSYPSSPALFSMPDVLNKTWVVNDQGVALNVATAQSAGPVFSGLPEFAGGRVGRLDDNLGLYFDGFNIVQVKPSGARMFVTLSGKVAYAAGLTERLHCLYGTAQGFTDAFLGMSANEQSEVVLYNVSPTTGVVDAESAITLGTDALLGDGTWLEDTSLYQVGSKTIVLANRTSGSGLLELTTEPTALREIDPTVAAIAAHQHALLGPDDKLYFVSGADDKIYSYDAGTDLVTEVATFTSPQLSGEEACGARVVEQLIPATDDTGPGALISYCDGVEGSGVVTFADWTFTTPSEPQLTTLTEVRIGRSAAANILVGSPSTGVLEVYAPDGSSLQATLSDEGIVHEGVFAVTLPFDPSPAPQIVPWQGTLALVHGRVGGKLRTQWVDVQTQQRGDMSSLDGIAVTFAAPIRSGRMVVQSQTEDGLTETRLFELNGELNHTDSSSNIVIKSLSAL